MNKTSASVLALLFSSASALRTRQIATPEVTNSMPVQTMDPPTTTTGEPLQAVHETSSSQPATHLEQTILKPSFTHGIVEQANALLNQNDQPMTLAKYDIKVQVVKKFNMWANGIEIGSGDNSSRFYEFHPIINEGVDTIAIELNSSMWSGNFLSELNGVAGTALDWVCKDVPNNSGLPEGWNLNAFDDRTWLPPVVTGVNNQMSTPYMFWVQTEISDQSEWVWSPQGKMIDRMMCRHNQLGYEARAKDAGMCMKEMHEFEDLLNQMIRHHEEKKRYWEDNNVNQLRIISEFSQKNVDLGTKIGELGEQIETNANNHAEAITKLDNEIEDLHDKQEEDIENLKTNLAEDCRLQVEGTQKKLNGEWTNTLDDAKAIHKQALKEQEEAHTQIVKDTIFDAKAEHKKTLDDKITEINKIHDDKVAATELEMNEKFDKDVADLKIKLAGEHKENLSQALDELTEKLRFEFRNRLADQQSEFDMLIAKNTHEYTKAAKDQAKTMGDEIERLTRKHDYLYESCTTVQVVDGELQIGA